MAKAQQQVVRLTHSNEGLRDENDLLYRDIQKMTARPLPSHWDVRYQAIPDRPVKEHRVSVRFLPWHYAWTDDPTVPRSEISNFTIHAIRNAARTLAQHHADEVERKIFDITMQQRTKEGHDGR